MSNRLLERLLDIERWKQAGEEAFHTFIVLFVPAFFAWASGLKDLPNFDEAKAAVAAMFTAAGGAALKALWWQLTGTRVKKAKKVKLENGYTLVETLLAVLIVIVILVVLLKVIDRI